LRASGRGTVACAAFGSIHKFVLSPGETRAVDNGHLVAWTARMQYRTGLANGGIMASMTSGEGLMCHFTGPGTIYLQSHKPGEAETVVKHGKANAKRGALFGGNAAIALFFAVCFFFLFLFVVVMFVTMAKNNDSNLGSSNGQYSGNDYFYSSPSSPATKSPASRKPTYRPPRTVNEF